MPGQRRVDQPDWLRDCELWIPRSGDGLRHRPWRDDLPGDARRGLLRGLLRHCDFDRMSGERVLDDVDGLYDSGLWHAYGVHGLRCGLGEHDVWVCVHVDLCDGLHWRSCVYCMWI